MTIKFYAIQAPGYRGKYPFGWGWTKSKARAIKAAAATRRAAEETGALLPYGIYIFEGDSRVQVLAADASDWNGCKVIRG